MALLSTAPPASHARLQKTQTALAAWSSPPTVPMPLLKAAMSASAHAAAGLSAATMILSTEEIKVSAGTDHDDFSVSVPRFTGHTQAKESMRAPPGLETNLAKPPGVHIAPPPGLARQTPAEVHDSMDTYHQRSFLGLPPPPPFPPSAPLSSAPSATAEEDVEEQNESDHEAYHPEPYRLPLPHLLASTPLPSLLGSAPLYGKTVMMRNIKPHKMSAQVEPFVPAKLAAVIPS